MIEKTKKKILLISIIISFIVLLVSTFLLAEYFARQNSPKKITSIVNSLTLIDHKGFAFNSNSFKQQPSLLFFGFTHCPEVCPTTLSELSEITDNLKTKIKTTNIIFITLDPERDTQKHLKEYIQYFGKNITGVTGTIKDLKKMANNFNVYYEKELTSKNNYTLNHTATVFMIDKEGNYRGTIAWGENENSTIQKIIKLSNY